MESGAWKLGAGLSLTNSQGEAVAIPYRKVGELLSLLAEAPSHTADREELAKRLWPDSLRADRLTNLRQCIARLRSVLPRSAVQSDRLRCSLSASFRLESTAGRAEGHSANGVPSPAFANLILWLAKNDPARMLETLRASPESGLAMGKTTLRTAMKFAASDHSLGPRDLAWCQLFRGVVELSTSMQRSSTWLSRAINQAEEIDDLPLLELAIYWHGVTLILGNRLNEAKKLATRAQVVYESKAKRPSRRIENLLAHVLLHQGDTTSALKRLEYIGDMGADAIADRSADQTLRALYLTFSERREEARRLLDEFNRLAIPPGVSRSSLYASLSDAYLDAEDSSSANFGKLENRVAEFALMGERHMEIYAREGLAVLLARKGKLIDGCGELSRSRGIRAQINLHYTAWDLARLEEFQSQGHPVCSLP